MAEAAPEDAPAPAREGEEMALAFSKAAARGRVLVTNHDAVVIHDAPFILACTCEGAALDLAIRRVTLFAFTLSGIIATIVALRAAPLPIIAIAIVWFVPAAAARAFAARRRREHGRFLVDFEQETVTRLASSAGAARDASAQRSPDEIVKLAGAAIEVERAFDASVPYWVILRSGPTRWRLARGQAEELRGVVRVFRGYRIEIRGSFDVDEPTD